MVDTKDHLEQHRKSFQAVAERHAKMGPPRHHSNAKRTVMVALVAVLVLLASAASVFAYMWYQSPERIVMNAILNTANQPAIGYAGHYRTVQGNGEFSGRTVEDRTAIDAKGTMRVHSQSLGFSGSVVLVDDRPYVKSDQLSQMLVGLLPKKLSNESLRGITQIAKEKLDGNWVELDSSSTSSLPGLSGSSACIADFFQKVSGSQQSRLHVVDLYRQNPFINVTEQSSLVKETSTYKLAIELSRYIAFKAALKKTELHASMISCTNDTAIMTEDEARDLTIDLTVDTEKTRVDNITLHNSNQQARLSANLAYDNIESVVKPADPVKVSDVQAEVFKNILSSRLRQLLGQ